MSTKKISGTAVIKRMTSKAGGKELLLGKLRCSASTAELDDMAIAPDKKKTRVKVTIDFEKDLLSKQD